MSLIPTEIWSLVFKHISSQHQINLLYVSRLFHDIVIQLLFSTVKIHFIGGDAALAMFDTDDEQFVQETTEKLMLRSWEILHRIIQEPKFAAVVRSITVIAFADAQSIFEQLTLAQAIRAIPNLRTFHWFGAFPQFSPRLAECLPQNLQNLCLQSIPTSSMLHHLNGPRQLQLVIPFFYPRGTVDDSLTGPSWAYDPGELADIIEITDAVSESLQKIVLLSEHVGSIPIRLYHSLTHLDVCVPVVSEISGIDLVFRHSPYLQSLSLVGFITSDIFSTLPRDSTILPSLKSFRLSCEFGSMPLVTHDHVAALLDFLKGRSILRRLSVRLAGAEWNVLSSLVAVIGKLSGLEVLGIHTGCEYLEPGDVEQLVSCLSPRLKAIHIATCWDLPDIMDLNIGLLAPLMIGLSRLPVLSFLHLYGIAGTLPVFPNDLATEMKHLTTVGLHRSLWSIDRTDPGFILTKWPSWKVKFNIEEDFLSKDDAWLFRYH